MEPEEQLTDFQSDLPEESIDKNFDSLPPPELTGVERVATDRDLVALAARVAKIESFLGLKG